MNEQMFLIKEGILYLKASTVQHQVEWFAFLVCSQATNVYIDCTDVPEETIIRLATGVHRDVTSASDLREPVIVGPLHHEDDELCHLLTERSIRTTDKTFDEYVADIISKSRT